MKAIDLFCGCGGFSKGLEYAGYDIVAACDKWESAIKVYAENFNHPIYDIDLGNISTADINKISSQGVDVIVGGPPCQDYSSAGKRDEQGGRANLTISFAEIVTDIKPKYFIMENVHNIGKYKTLGEAKKIFKEAGYGLNEVILDASYYGVPQARKRYFLVGELNGEDGVIEPYLCKNASKEKMTVRDYLGDELGVEYYYRHPRSYNRRGVFSIDEPSPTIRGVNRPIPSGYNKHDGDKADINEGVRPLTTIERSYIQTFPKNFKFNGTKTNLEQIIGNAVPVKLAEHVGVALKEYIMDNNKNTIINNKQMSLFEVLS